MGRHIDTYSTERYAPNYSLHSLRVRQLEYPDTNSSYMLVFSTRSGFLHLETIWRLWLSFRVASFGPGPLRPTRSAAGRTFLKIALVLPARSARVRVYAEVAFTQATAPERATPYPAPCQPRSALFLAWPLCSSPNGVVWRSRLARSSPPA